MDRLLDYTLNGLSFGAVYALLALALVVVFRGTGDLNFAQGEMATLSTFIVWVANNAGVPLLLAMVIGMIFGLGLGAVVEVTLIRPLAKRSKSSVFVVLIALFLGINALTSGLWGSLPDEVIGSLFPNDPKSFLRIGGVTWRYEYIGVFVASLAATGLVLLLFRKTRFGLAMRGVASNPSSARLVGVPTGVVLMTSWGIAGALGALAGTLFAGTQGQVRPEMMLTVFVYAIAAATLGGLDSAGGAIVAGLLIGVVENLAAGYFPQWVGQEMKLVVALVAIFVVLLVRPSGLFGTTQVDRV